jgi:hypothetical protein
MSKCARANIHAYAKKHYYKRKHTQLSRGTFYRLYNVVMVLKKRLAKKCKMPKPPAKPFAYKDCNSSRAFNMCNLNRNAVMIETNSVSA